MLKASGTASLFCTLHREDRIHRQGRLLFTFFKVCVVLNCTVFHRLILHSQGLRFRRHVLLRIHIMFRLGIHCQGHQLERIHQGLCCAELHCVSNYSSRLDFTAKGFIFYIFHSLRLYRTDCRSQSTKLFVLLNCKKTRVLV